MTVVEHELGHALGFEHEDAAEYDVMRETITLLVPPSTPDLTTDTGFSAADNVTNDNTPTFAGTAVAGFVVSFFDIFFDITSELGLCWSTTLGATRSRSVPRSATAPVGSRAERATDWAITRTSQRSCSHDRHARACDAGVGFAGG